MDSAFPTPDSSVRSQSWSGIPSSDAQREAVVHAHPRNGQFKEDIIQAFYDGIRHKPNTTFGNVKADVLAGKDPAFRLGNFCSVIRGSAWRG
jgi:hypothetical protein